MCVMKYRTISVSGGFLRKVQQTVKSKLVFAEYTLSDFFYPRAEIKRRTNAAKMLKAVGYGNEAKTST